MDSIPKNTINFENRERQVNLWRPTSLINLPKAMFEKDKVKKSDRSWNTIVTIVLVEAKCLPGVPVDGASHTVYCKFRLGQETFRSKSVQSSTQPKWGERFQLHLYEDYILNVSLKDKGKMKNSMGSCILDLSTFTKERTHEIWQKLDNGYGEIHIAVTMCAIRPLDSPSIETSDSNDCNERHDHMILPTGWNVVGLLHVKVICAKGLTSKPNAYCTLEIDNERVETHRAGASSEPRWNKCYVFKVYDVSSTLDLKVYDSSITNALLNDSIGKVSIPLLRVNNGLIRWHALKNRSKRNNARGNCPRILLQMSLVWNPVKATLKLFQPKEVRYIKKPEKFDIFLIYSNMKFISDLLNVAVDVNEYYKRLFEWDDVEFSFFVLLGWVVFCYYFRLWTVPLLVLLPYFYNWIFNRPRDNVYVASDYAHDDRIDNKEEKTFSGKLQDLHKMTFTIKNGIEFISSYIERLQSLITFKVPFLSFVSMFVLIMASAGLYFIPFNYLLMSLGIYKFTRKYLNPDRVLNNDFIDFLSRVPDNEILKDWKELGVPEPNQEYQGGSPKIRRSISTST